MSTQFIKTTWVVIIAIWATQTTSFIKWVSCTKSIYEALESNGLPMGLLPKGVKNYTLDNDGNFEVYLDQACNAKFECEFHYNQTVTGQMSVGQIRNLTGIAAQDLFLWLPVKGVRVDIPSSGVIYFDVGLAYKQFSLSLFETPRDCVAVAVANLPDLDNGRLIDDKFDVDVLYSSNQRNEAREVM